MSAYLTVKDVAQQLGVSKKSVQRWIADGAIAAFRISPRIWRVRAQDVPQSQPQPKPRARKTDLPESGVYMLYLAGELIYIGRSTALPRRVATHRRSGRTFDEVRAIPCEPAVADWLEGELVRTLRPLENVKRFERRARRAALIEAALAEMVE